MTSAELHRSPHQGRSGRQPLEQRIDKTKRRSSQNLADDVLSFDKSLRMHAFDLVLLDFDGTLCDTRPAITHCIARSFEVCGRPTPRSEDIRSAVAAGLTLADTMVHLDVQLAFHRVALDEQISTYRELYLNESEPLLGLFDGVKDTLIKLREMDVKCSVVSNKGVEAIRRYLDQNALTTYIGCILGDEPGLPKKPDAKLFDGHIRAHFPSLKRNRILIIGDTDVDILFAKNSGIHSCWASYGYGDPQKCKALTPDYCVTSFVELSAIVRDAGAKKKPRRRMRTAA